MMFSKKKITMAYTVEQCTKCGMQIKRKFKEGDVLFVNATKCVSCGGLSIIEKIFGDSIDQ